eukprot:s397_g14.t1
MVLGTPKDAIGGPGPSTLTALPTMEAGKGRQRGKAGNGEKGKVKVGKAAAPVPAAPAEGPPGGAESRGRWPARGTSAHVASRCIVHPRFHESLSVPSARQS